jgi:hypothetical protein
MVAQTNASVVDPYMKGPLLQGAHPPCQQTRLADPSVKSDGGANQVAHIHPVTILRARYPHDRGGWFALPCDPWDVPREIFDDENTAYAWYEETGVQSFGGRYGGLKAPVPVGIGVSPSEANEDLIAVLRTMEPFRRFGPSADGTHSYDYEITWPNGERTEVSLWDRSV